MGQWEVCVVVRKKSERRCGLHRTRFAPEMILEAAHSADPQHSWKVHRPGSDYNLSVFGTSGGTSPLLLRRSSRSSDLQPSGTPSPRCTLGVSSSLLIFLILKV